MSDEVKLLPCPFAMFDWSGDHELVIADGLPSSRGAPVEFCAGCSDCDVYTPQCATAEDAVRLWNTRAIEATDEVVERVARAISTAANDEISSVTCEIYARAAIEATRPTILTGEVRDAVIAAYIAGATDVHENWQEDRDPDFREAAHDYAAAQGTPHDN